MSDNWIVLIPEDPHFVPNAAVRGRARDRLAAIASGADEVAATVDDDVAFFDCGENFETVRCPRCGATIPMEWWQDRMDEDYADGFKLDGYAVPCCGASLTLHELAYDRPQGFGRFSLSARNPNRGPLEAEQLRELSDIVGGRLRVIYRHL